MCPVSAQGLELFVKLVRLNPWIDAADPMLVAVWDVYQEHNPPEAPSQRDEVGAFSMATRD